MPAEVLQFLSPRPGGVYLDGTLGGGGHAALILKATAPDGILIGFDKDREALAAAAERLAVFGGRLKLVHGNFANLEQELAVLGIKKIDGFIFDLGVSSHQLDTADRGFSFLQDAPLDMRMDRSVGETAAELVNSLSERELAKIIKDFGEERWAARIAAFIVKAREERLITTTSDLAGIVKGAVPKACWEDRIHPATRTFQGLRIVVNDELGSVERGVEQGVDHLRGGGRGVVISFHSLEDRIVKTVFRDFATGCRCPKELPRCVCGGVPRVKVLTGKPVMAGAEEIEANPRARSAKLRAVEKL